MNIKTSIEIKNIIDIDSKNKEDREICKNFFFNKKWVAVDDVIQYLNQQMFNIGIGAGQKEDFRLLLKEVIKQHEKLRKQLEDTEK